MAALILFLPKVFQEFDLTDRIKKSMTESDQGQAKLDKVLLWVLIACYWIFYVNFVILET